MRHGGGCEITSGFPRPPRSRGRKCSCLLLISFVSKNISIHLRALAPFPARHTESRSEVRSADAPQG